MDLLVLPDGTVRAILDAEDLDLKNLGGRSPVLLVCGKGF